MAQELTPAAGMGVTIVVGTDSYPATITLVSSPTTIRVQHDLAKRTDTNGQSGPQEYTFWQNPMGKIEVFTLRNNNRWVKRGKDMHSYPALTLGERSKYIDHTF